LLAGRAAVVVGGTRGIGLAVAELLAAQGARVVVNGRDPDAVDEAAQRVSGIGQAGSPADPQVADALVDACVAEFGADNCTVWSNVTSLKIATFGVAVPPSWGCR